MTNIVTSLTKAGYAVERFRPSFISAIQKYSTKNDMSHLEIVPIGQSSDPILMWELRDFGLEPCFDSHIIRSTDYPVFKKMNIEDAFKIIDEFLGKRIK